MKLDWRLVLVLVLSLGLMVSCDSTEEDEDIPTAFESLTAYMAANDMDATSVVSDWSITAATVSANPTGYFVMDIRNAPTFAAGHIPGAVNCAGSAVVTTVEELNTDDLPVVVTCYSGQSACNAIVALRLSGYPEAKSLLWGMSSWGPEFDRWSASIDSVGKGHASWSMAAAPALPAAYAFPVIDTDLTDGSAILAMRVDSLLAQGYKSISGATVLDAPENYEIINYWDEASYNLYGHIDGAYQIAPGTLTIANDAIAILDPGQLVVTYCWTGQTSSMMTSWLRVLGYDATSLKNGANAMIYHSLQGHKWTPVTTSYPTEN